MIESALVSFTFKIYNVRVVMILMMVVIIFFVVWLTNESAVFLFPAWTIGGEVSSS